MLYCKTFKGINMTKKFFKDWYERRSLTESIELKKGLQYESILINLFNI